MKNRPKTGSSSSSSSSLSSASSSSEDDSSQSQASHGSDIVSNGSSFLESLSQKYSTGQQTATSTNGGRVGRETRYPGSGYHRKSFLNRLKNTTVNPTATSEHLPPFLTELKSKVKMTDDIDDVPVGIGISVSPGASLKLSLIHI